MVWRPDVQWTESTPGSGSGSRRRRALSISLYVMAAALVAVGAVSARLFWKNGSLAESSVSSDETDETARHFQSQEAAVESSRAHHAASSNPAAPDADLYARLEAVRAATSKYQDVSVAQSEGFRLVVRELPGMGAHFVQVGNGRSTTFDPARPNMLLYEQKAGKWELMAVGYILSKQAFPTPPEYFPGAQWHSHQSLCIFSSGSVGLMPEGECRSKSGFWVDDTGWMLHVWLYKENPAGVLSELNPAVSSSR